MGLSEILRLLDGAHSIEEAVTAYHAAKEGLERSRRERFSAFGVPAEEPCPAARVYHRYSTITPDWTPLLTSEESYAHAVGLGYKAYPGSARVALPPTSSTTHLERVIAARRSVHEFADAPVSLADIAGLLGTSAGVTRAGELPLRAAPSAGALFPVETYLLAFRVEGLATGLYHYAALSHVLERVGDVPDRATVTDRVLAPGLATVTPAAVVALAAVFRRVETKYGERGYRFALLEAGHLAQNLSLVAASRGLAGNCIGGFCDQEANQLLGLDGDHEAVVYLFLTGRPGHQPSDA